MLLLPTTLLLFFFFSFFQFALRTLHLLGRQALYHLSHTSSPTTPCSNLISGAMITTSQIPAQKCNIILTSQNSGMDRKLGTKQVGSTCLRSEESSREPMAPSMPRRPSALWQQRHYKQSRFSHPVF
jgi:hypothetical protein